MATSRNLCSRPLGQHWIQLCTDISLFLTRQLSPIDFQSTGIAWVTFDSTSGTAGSPTPRIFVGVANQGSSNIFVSTNGGSTCMSMMCAQKMTTESRVGSAVAGQNTTYLPHKGVLSPTEKVLYISYSNGGMNFHSTERKRSDCKQPVRMMGLSEVFSSTI
jgi:hypothetical protein